jgi:PAS domain S-box-containing protein
MHVLKESASSRTTIWGAAIAILISLFTFWEIMDSHESPQLKAFQILALFACTVLLAAVLILTGALQQELQRTARLSMFQSALSEAAGIAAQNRYSELVETIPAIVWQMDPSTLAITFINQHLKAMSGYPAEIWKSNPRFWIESVPPEDREKIFHLLESVRNGQHVDIEHRMIRPDQKTVWIRTIANLSGEGELVGISTDITQRKLAEFALRESEKKLAALLDTLPVSVFILDTNGEVLLSNPAGKKLWGEAGPPTPSFVGHLASEIASSDLNSVSDRVRRWVESFKTNGHPQLNIELTHADRSILRSVVPLQLDDEQANGMVVMDIDVTDVRSANAALRISERKFATFFEQTMMGVIEWDKDFRVREWNPAASVIFGFSREEAIGRSAFDLVVPPESHGSANTILSDLLTGSGGQYSTNENVRKDGSRVTCEWFNTALKGKGGITGTMSLVHDISGRAIAEKSLRELSGRLLQTQENERCRIARELHDDIGQQVAILGMEIHQERSPRAELYSRAKELGQSISRLSHELHSSRLELLGLASATEAACRIGSRDMGIDVLFLASKVPQELDPDLGLYFYRILQESLHNIQKHSGATRVQVELLGKQSEIVLRIRDNGRGFDTTSDSNWKGLGLSSMRERMHLINGRLTIVSQPGQGTTIEAVAPLRVTVTA